LEPANPTGSPGIAVKPARAVSDVKSVAYCMHIRLAGLDLTLVAHSVQLVIDLPCTTVPWWNAVDIRSIARDI